MGSGIKILKIENPLLLKIRSAIKSMVRLVAAR